MDSPFVLLIVALAVTSLLAFYNRLWGGIAGLIVTMGMAAWGFNAYEQGKTVAFFGAALDRTAFLALMGGFAVANAIQVVRAIKK